MSILEAEDTCTYIRPSIECTDIPYHALAALHRECISDMRDESVR